MSIPSLFRSWRRSRLPTWYDPAYRLPLPALEARSRFDPRRADLACWHLRDVGALTADDLRTPIRARYADLIRVHTAEMVEGLTQPEALARVFGLDPWDVPVDALLRTLRLAVGGTVAAAREAVIRSGPTLNLLGGFHHATPDRAAGFSPVNDIAVAVAALRADGFTGTVAVLDLDAHPPDGTAACLGGDAWLGSLSGSDWGPLPEVDEQVLAGADDQRYLAALAELLGRMPRAALTFVVAGGDVLAGDQNGLLALTLDGARRRDHAVARALAGRGSVWLPAGGYHKDAWRVLAGTGLVLTLGSLEPIDPAADPVRSRYARVSAGLTPDRLSGDLDMADIEAELGLRRADSGRLLGHYTAEGAEYALAAFGVLDAVERLGYRDLGVRIGTTDVGDRFQLFGSAAGATHLLSEAVVERSTLAGKPILFIHWLTLRHPLAAFRPGRAPLPGQEVPGLGLAREAAEIYLRMAERVGLAGVAFRPAHYHVARAAGPRFQFPDPVRQGRFEALSDALAHLEFGAAARAVAEGRVLVDGKPYRWEPDVMVEWRDGTVSDRAAIEAARGHTTVTLATSGAA